jgi:transposase
MTHVQIDDLDCPYCEKITLGNLDIKRQEYSCLRCGNVVD